MLFITITILLSSCSSRWKTNPNNYLLTKYKVKSNQKTIKKSDVKEVIYPNKNRSVLGLRFYLWMYEMGDHGDIEQDIKDKQDKLNKKNQKKLQKYEVKKKKYHAKKVRKNKRREKRKRFPKDIKPYKRFKPKEYKPTFKQWLMEVVGEAPVLMDTAKAKDIKKQVVLYLEKHGYFDANVSYDLKYKKYKQKVKVLIYIDAELPYMINEVGFEIEDPIVEKYLSYVLEDFSIKEGKQYDEEDLEQERKNIADYLQTKGYFNFRKLMVTYDIDSTIGNRELDVLVRVGDFYEEINDSVFFSEKHLRFQIGNVDVYIDSENVNEELSMLSYKGYNFYYAGKLKYNPKFLLQNIFLYKGEVFNSDNVKQTYKRLSSLSVFKFIEIEFRKSDSVTLETKINLISSKKNSYSIETNGTVSGSDLGLNATFTYNIKNLFKGGELLRFKLTGGIEAAKAITNTDDPNDNSLSLKPNTVEFGPEISLIFPKFLLPVRQDRFKKSLVPSTSFNFILNYQDRPDFKRIINRVSFGYGWRQNVTIRQVFRPIDISLISIDRSPEFDDYLEEINDPILKSSYQDHFIPATIYDVFYNNQNKKLSKHKLFNFLHLEASGNLLRALAPSLGLQQDSLGGYQVFDITFAQYLKFQNDFRYTKVVNDKNSFAYRAIFGVAYALENLGAIPFERSFFVGGANDIRAWQARTLGPGSYFDPLRNYDKIGDIKIEFNAEYRFNLIDFIDAALFIDVGNIWLVKENPARPGGDFDFSRFYKELAVSTGVGLRLNFNLFIIRLDLGLQTYDPSLPTGERWVWESKDEYNQIIDDLNAAGTLGQSVSHYQPRFNLNLGIGYPF